VKCPICNQEVQPSDHSEQWGPEFAHSRCVVAFNAGSAVQDAKLLARIKRLEDRIHRASMAFFRDGSDGHVASQMLQILEEERGEV
jgi:hypothetical protein